MWNCTRCQAENRDSVSVCETCGSPRAAGRFGQPAGMGSTARMPRVTAPASREGAARAAAHTVSTASAAPAIPDAPGARRSYAPAPEPPKRGAIRVFAKIVGGLLLVLLPLLCAALCVNNQSVLREALLPLLLPEGTDGAVGALCYWALAAVAVLLSMLPGLWTILLAGSNGKRRPARRE